MKVMLPEESTCNGTYCVVDFPHVSRAPRALLTFAALLRERVAVCPGVGFAGTIPATTGPPTGTLRLDVTVPQEFCAVRLNVVLRLRLSVALPNSPPPPMPWSICTVPAPLVYQSTSTGPAPLRIAGDAE